MTPNDHPHGRFRLRQRFGDPGATGSSTLLRPTFGMDKAPSLAFKYPLSFGPQGQLTFTA